MQYLEVPFREKDQAKALGARWDAVRRKWFVPDQLAHDLTPFQRWLPQQVDLPVAEDDANDTAMSLSQLLAHVGQAVQAALPQAVWVRAEIAELSQRRGHVYLDLVETAEDGTEIARSRALIWKSQAKVLLEKFEQATGSTLAVGQKVLLGVRARFHERFGFSLEIDDIDPSYTLGDMQAQLRRLREQLQKQGLYDRNRQLPAPTEFVRVAVIAPPQAAGLGDFRRDAEQLEAHGLCTFTYFHAAFQGEAVESEFMAAFDAVEALHRQRPFDALVIIRGGGAQLDLHQLNRLAIAERIARAPLPVLTGIGHERDSTLLDEVACQRFDTPSKVIAHIRDTIVHNARQAQEDWQRLRHLASLRVRQADEALDRVARYIRHQARHSLTVQRHLLDSLRTQAMDGGRRQLAEQRHALQRSWTQVAQMARAPLRLSRQALAHHWQQVRVNALRLPVRAREQVQQWMRFILAAGPERQLQRGFALVRDVQGNVVATAQQAREHKALTVEFHDGKVKVRATDE
ncbi:exodeoxyribonuclease VII large subunit [Sulfurivirga sp.]|uniref:exodeoxyribonuclease VII large subunit n=1 Tax=Sulfurivirga sp. TaxID=2614236 RepID=UPI0025FC2062|nr:exodeoxyribonuclease VII large subunit [Sulfurivirga sp.]